MFISSFAQATRTAAFVIGSVATLVIAAPAMADEAPKPDMATATVASKPLRYCFQTETTGSLIISTKCQTRAEWLRFGVDPKNYLQSAPKRFTGRRDPMPGISQ